MKHINFKQTNHHPKTKEKNGMHALILEEPAASGFSRKHIISKWKPSEAERKAIAHGADLWLDVIGAEMPLLTIGIKEPFENIEPKSIKPPPKKPTPAKKPTSTRKKTADKRTAKKRGNK